MRLCTAIRGDGDYASTNHPRAVQPDEPEKEKLPPKGVIHLQEIKDVPQVDADQNCKNYSWAASLQPSWKRRRSN